MKTSGIYKIVNKVNGKYYVGSSMNVYARWTDNHRRHLRKNKHINKHLQSSWNKYGEKNFNFIIVEELTAPSKNFLLEVEQRYLDIANKEKHKCYNKNFTSSGGAVYVKHPMVGRKHAIESIIKNRESNKIAQKGLKNARADLTVRKFYNTNTGEVFEGTRYEFYSKYPKCKSNLYKLIDGKNNVKSIHGWILDPNASYGKCKAETNAWTDHTIYSLKNINTGQHFSGKRYEFTRKFGFRPKPALFQGKRNIDHGWIIYPPIKNQNSINDLP